MRRYTRDEVYAASLRYFRGDHLAADTFFKYALQDKQENYYELTPDDMHHRLAKEFARAENSFGGPRALPEEEIYSLLADFKYICPQGSPMMGIGNDFQHISLSNCVVVDSPEDNMSSIMNTARDLANLFKRRCGVGVDLSKLRPDGTVVNNAAKTSSGAWSFSELYSFVTKMVGQKNRRGALMISMDVRHPDIMQFAKMKRDLSKVTGANVSVRLTDDFMRAVQDDRPYQLQWPVDAEEPEIVHEVSARHLWDTIIESATGVAEPGLLFWDAILKHLPAHCYPEFLTLCVNPCGELPLSANDSCRLISQNLKWYVKNPFTADAYFDFELLEQHTRIAQRLSDDLVELEREKLTKLIAVADTLDESALFDKLATAAEQGRRTGLGTHGLADVFLRMRMRYDSDEAVALADNIYGTRKIAAYSESVDLARERGPFPVFDWEKEKNNAFILSLPQGLRDRMAKYGRRNSSLLTNAPTGSVSIESQTESGMEPNFRFKLIRRKKKGIGEPPLDTDVVDDEGDRWVEFEVESQSLKDWKSVVGGDQRPLPDYFVQSDQIDWMKRITMQATIQKHIDHSISSTINLPKGTSAEVVSNLYLKAWEEGLKGITVYVEGSRDGVLIDKETKFEYISAPKRPDDLDCDIHHASVKGEKWCIFVGLLDDKPYEVFGGLADNIELPKEYKKGTISKGAVFKSAPNRYDLKVNGFVIKNVIRQFDNPTHQVLTRMVSLGLRHGAKPSFLMEQLQKDPDNDLTSFSKVLARVLKRYVKDDTIVTSDKVCPECSSEGLIYQEGCVTCKGCGYSKCG